MLNNRIASIAPLGAVALSGLAAVRSGSGVYCADDPTSTLDIFC
jgi:hypothetical protein